MLVFPCCKKCEEGKALEELKSFLTCEMVPVYQQPRSERVKRVLFAIEYSRRYTTSPSYNRAFAFLNLSTSQPITCLHRKLPECHADKAIHCQRNATSFKVFAESNQQVWRKQIKIFFATLHIPFVPQVFSFSVTSSKLGKKCSHRFYNVYSAGWVTLTCDSHNNLELPRLPQSL